MEPTAPKTTTLSRDDVLRSLRGVLPVLDLFPVDVRMVGTASSLLRGIDLPVGDVDILVRQRPVVDELSARVTSIEGRCISPPTWTENPWFGQYFAEFDLHGVHVGFSTVEVKPAHPPGIGECIRDAPWEYFDAIDVEGHRLAVVASELRLLSEIVRSRPDRWKPIGAQLALAGYDDELFQTALESLPPDLQDIMREAVREPRA